MKKTILLMMLFSILTVAYSQEIIVGDINDDKVINISDVTELVNIVLGKSSCKTISFYKIDNSSIIGTWRTIDGNILNFNEDGTTNYDTGCTYSFLPNEKILFFLKNDGSINSAYNVLNKTKNLFLLNPINSEDKLNYYTSSLFITAIKISDTDISLRTGDTYQLSATIEPENAIQPNLSWKTSNSSIATVSQNGTVTAKKGGEAIITAIAMDGTGVKSTCHVNISQLVTSIEFPYPILTVGRGNIFTLNAKVFPSNAKDQSLTWSSSNNNSLLSIDEGTFYAINTGTYSITATANDGSNKMATCKVIVLGTAPIGINLSSSIVTIKPGDSTQLTAIVTPLEASTATVIWTSSNPSIATVDQTGKVTVHDYGNVIITATVVGNDALFATATIQTDHEYVDLNLPSGRLWATCNVGAELPEEFGNYYAWGEVKAYGEEDTENYHNYNNTGNYQKKKYEWSTYKYTTGNSYDGPYLKYNFKKSYGTYDNSYTLELKDDAAYVNWGENWRMPTYKDWDELKNNCIWSWTSINGVNGYKVSSKSDISKFIFLPAANYRDDEATFEIDENNGNYWSNHLYHSDYSPSDSETFKFTPNNYYTYTSERYNGLSVRAVRR